MYIAKIFQFVTFFCPIASVLLAATASAPKNRFESVLAVHTFLDTISQQYAQRQGIALSSGKRTIGVCVQLFFFA